MSGFESGPTGADAGSAGRTGPALTPGPHSRVSLAGWRRPAGGLGRPEVAGVAGAAVTLQFGEHFAQFVELAAQVVAGGDLADGQPQRRQFTGQVLGVGLRLLGAATVLLQRHPVAVLLPVLGEQDQ